MTDSKYYARLISGVLCAGLLMFLAKTWFMDSGTKHPQKENQKTTQNGTSEVGNQGGKAETESGENKGKTVYITKSGKKYHAANCNYLSKSKIPISLNEAKNRGFEPCSKCRPGK